MKRFLIASISLSLFLFMACGSSQEKKDEPPVVQSNMDYSAWVKASNSQLAKIPVGGFGYKKADVPPRKWDKWAKGAAPVVKGIIDKMPPGYVLQVTGHTDSRGPEEPEGNKPGNIKLSEDRAEAVYKALRNNGITSNRMTFKGIGSSQPRAGINPRSSAQRRVTFEVVPE